MKEKKNFIQIIINFLGSLISCTISGLILILFLLFVAMTVKVIDRWNQPMLIPEAHGITYSELIHNRLDGWEYNEDIYGESANHCKVITISGLSLSFPMQIIYTYAGFNPDSKVINYIDPRDIRAGYIPDNVKITKLLEGWWWVVEKFSWGTYVDGITNSGVELCRLPVP